MAGYLAGNLTAISSRHQGNLVAAVQHGQLPRSGVPVQFVQEEALQPGQLGAPGGQRRGQLFPLRHDPLLFLLDRLNLVSQQRDLVNLKVIKYRKAVLKYFLSHVQVIL